MQTIVAPDSKSPLEWAADCHTAAENETDIQTKSALQQLATEFETLAQEIEGLISSFGALTDKQGDAGWA